MRQLYVDVDEFAMKIIQQYCVWISTDTAHAGYTDNKQFSSAIIGDAMVRTLNTKPNPALRADNIADSCDS